MRHHDEQGKHGGHLHFGHHQWVQVDGTVLERRLLHPERPAPHAKVFIIRLHPPGQPPLTVEIPLHPSDKLARDLAQPSAGEVRSFLYDPSSGKVQFDPEDPRNSMAMLQREADELASMLDDTDDDY